MKRIENVQKCLQKWGVDLLIIDDPLDLLYLTGQELSAGQLVIFEKEVTLYVDGRYYEVCKKELSIPVALLSRESTLPLFEGKRVGFDAGSTTYESFEKLAALKGECVPLPRPLQAIREVKDSGEIAFLREAAKLGSQGFDHIASKLVEGMTEEELVIELEVFWKRAGGQRVAFTPHIAFGENSAYPHYHSGKRRLKRGDVVLIDIGVVLNHYHSDMTRVLFFGEVDPQLREIYRIVHQAQLKALALCKPGTSLADLDRVARGVIEAEGYGEFFLHSLGHGIGLEIHEAPMLRKTSTGVLKEGMAITIEPGIYLAGKGGVRLEDTIVITQGGYENLTTIPILTSPMIE